TTLETTVREVADELLRSRRSCGGVACTSDDADAGLEHVGVPVDFRAGIKQRHFENTPSITKEPRATTARPAGIARNSRLFMSGRSSISGGREPSTREPPDENGEIAVACEPITMQTNRITGEIPVELAIAGTTG